MKENETKIMECIELPHGLEIDLDEGWRKLISRQFGGNPGRAFGELIQNLLDSYPLNTPWEERRGEIETNEESISITDYGEGMDRERLKLITTLGGTDKSNDPSKIGTFGVGFFSVFNPKLGTERVRVITRCEGHTVELVFYVDHPEKIPRISTQVLKFTPSFSTKIEVKFNNKGSVKKCLEHAAVCLKYYPCRIFINGQSFTSVWEEAKASGAILFKEDHCDGFMKPKSWGDSGVRLLCKYQYLMYLSIPGLITGGHDMTHDLRDYHQKEVPFLPALDMTLNCNNLMVTISRDNFFLDSAYRAMIKVLARKLLVHLGQHFNDRTEKCLIIANQYILAKKIKSYLQRKSEGKTQTAESEEDSVIRRLAETKVYRLSGRKNSYSLMDMQKMLSQDSPLFFSSEQT
ncbi:MAG: ATP-binding protein, partial [Deltaproteobacteria bacterium]|nr:ATP-binding protein [Deltaproteobacteria bacterium]